MTEPKMVPKVFEGKANARCNGEPTNWGNLGKGTEDDCKAECLKEPKCKFAVINTDRGLCTGFAQCSTPEVHTYREEHKTKGGQEKQFRVFMKQGAESEETTPTDGPAPEPSTAPERELPVEEKEDEEEDGPEEGGDEAEGEENELEHNDEEHEDDHENGEEGEHHQEDNDEHHEEDNEDHDGPKKDGPKKDCPKGDWRCKPARFKENGWRSGRVDVSNLDVAKVIEECKLTGNFRAKRLDGDDCPYLKKHCNEDQKDIGIMMYGAEHDLKSKYGRKWRGSMKVEDRWPGILEKIKNPVNPLRVKMATPPKDPLPYVETTTGKKTCISNSANKPACFYPPFDPRRGVIYPGEFLPKKTIYAPDGKSAGNGTCWTKYDHKKCVRQMSGTQFIPLRKYPDPKGVDWCKANAGKKPDLCDQIKAKYDEIEKMEAEVYRLNTERAHANHNLEHKTMFGVDKWGPYLEKVRKFSKECWALDQEKLIPALAALNALNVKVTR